jgi:ring-1,2-phenylacetyl-CoA epoxidase subunit PaaC
MQLDKTSNTALFNYTLQLGDDFLVLGHQLSLWCGHGPFLEEDIALTNIALDHIGSATNLLTLAGSIEGQGRTADDLAFYRDVVEFKNCSLVEQPNIDFGHTIVRQFLYSSYCYFLYDKLQESKYKPLADVCEKAFKEVCYHTRHAKQWIIRLGDGTAESHLRVQRSLADLWPHVGELFLVSESEQMLINAQIVPSKVDLQHKWKSFVSDVLSQATLSLPSDDTHMSPHARNGVHNEHLCRLITEMQSLPRAFPGASW